jgi:hypothetical protein
MVDLTLKPAQVSRVIRCSTVPQKTIGEGLSARAAKRRLLPPSVPASLRLFGNERFVDVLPLGCDAIAETGRAGDQALHHDARITVVALHTRSSTRQKTCGRSGRHSSFQVAVGLSRRRFGTKYQLSSGVP